MQHGVVTVAQLAAAGVGRRGVAHRVAHGRLTRLHRGVYRVGPVEAPLTPVMAAVLACGARAVASHRTAAALHGFAQEPACVDVTVPAGHPRDRPGIRIHRSPLDGDVTATQGIPVTTVERTIRDLAGRISDRELKRTIEEALIQRRLDHSSLTDAVSAARGHHGAAALRAAAAAVSGAGDGVTRSEAERDRRRDADLAAAGFRVIRVTWRQLTDEPEAVVARFAAALAR